MTDSELDQLRYAGFTKQEINNLRKVSRSATFLTSDNTSFPDSFTLELPQEARFFFGMRRTPSSKVNKEVDIVLNEELVCSQINATLLTTRKRDNYLREEYIEFSRRLHGNDSLKYNINYGATIVEGVTWFYAVDVTVQPKEGK